MQDRTRAKETLTMDTVYDGRIDITPPLNADEIRYLHAFSIVRHCATGPAYRLDNPDRGIRQNDTHAQWPSLHCDFEPTPDGTALVWNGIEKTTAARQWIQAIIDHFLAPGGHAQHHPGFETFTFDHICDGRLDLHGDGGGWSIDVTANTVTSRETAAA